MDGSSKHGHEEETEQEYQFQTVGTHHAPRNPRRKAKYNLISRLFFFWLEGLFLTGFRRSLNQRDLYAHPGEADSERLLHTFNCHWQTEIDRSRRGQNARLWMALFKCVWWRICVHGVLALIAVSIQTAQPIVLGEIADYFTIEEPTAQQTRNVYLYALGLVVMAFVVAVLLAHAFLGGQRNGMIVRVIATSAIYQKVIRLNQTTIGKLSVGHIVNLASNDVQRFDLALMFMHYLWIGPIYLIVFTYLVYSQVGWSVFIVTAFVILQIPVQFGFARTFSYLRLKSAGKTDQRIKVMNEVISGIRVIKMYAWEHAFKKVVSRLRRLESNIIIRAGVLQSSTLMFTISVWLPTTAFLIFVPFVATGGVFTAKNVFFTLALLELLRRLAGFLFVNALYNCLEAFVAVTRIQKLLNLDEVHSTIADHKYFKLSAEDSDSPSGVKVSTADYRPPGAVAAVSVEGYFRPESPWLPGSSVARSSLPPAITPSSPPPPFVKTTVLSASWNSDRDKMVLKDISFEVSQKHNVMAVIGAVGAGKSTLLQCLLGELRAMDGSVEVNGRVSYASQDPWVFSGTLRENILFGLPYKPIWYNAVLEACALDKDAEQLIDGDLTLVGERGVTLSGGQKARVNLARAVYRNADVYLLDDPLSAVDTSVAKHLFDVCIRGLLGDRVVVLVTHQLQFALQADKILAINDGQVEVYGSMSELEEQGIDPMQLLRLMHKEEEESDEFAYSDSEDEGEILDEAPELLSPCLRKKAAAVDRSQTGDALDTSSIYSSPSMLSIHSAMEVGTSKHDDEEPLTFGPPEEEKAHGRISMKTYYQLFRAGGSLLAVLLVAVVFVMGEGGVVLTDWWLADWVRCTPLNTSEMSSIPNSSNESIPSRCLLTTDQRIGIYTGVAFASVLLNFSRAILLVLLCINASRVLHNRMFASVLRAPVRFFDTNPIGRVLNRFSKDVGFLDNLLPSTFLQYLTLMLRCLAIFGTAAAANAYVLIPVVFIIVIFLSLRWYYLKTSRDVKRLEAIARSPLYSHISATLQGLPTIRAFGRQHVSLEQFHKYQNEHTQGWYLSLVTTRWFSMRLDFLSAVFLAAVVFGSIPLASELNPGLVGLALTYALSLAGNLQYCVRLSAEVENLMVSGERIMGYSQLESEASLDTLPPSDQPPTDWPDKGHVTMDNVCFQYSSELPLVLKDLTFSVQPAEKIGIVGRTGAGKSSLLSVLFRLAEPYGSITIDGVETKSLGLHDLRKNMSIIPQDPVLFSGTMRYNLDPFDDYSDAELWAVLEQVQLKEAVEQLEGRLEGEVSEGGSNFSVGQRQLVCLARALLRKNKILILDEATANVDVSTDSIIQSALRERFADCTVLTIAHRLNTIMDSDRILVMNKGQVKEFDSPHRLLLNASSQFSKMVDKTGPTASQKLRAMAQEAHTRKRGGGGGGGGGQRRRSSAARKSSDAAFQFLINSVPMVQEPRQTLT